MGGLWPFNWKMSLKGEERHSSLTYMGFLIINDHRLTNLLASIAVVGPNFSFLFICSLKMRNLYKFGLLKQQQSRIKTHRVGVRILYKTQI